MTILRHPQGSADRGIALLIVLFLLALWEWHARSGALSALFFPAPSAIARDILRLAANGELASHMIATLGRLVVAGGVGGLCGLAAGLALGWSPRLRAVVDPFVAAVHPIPKVAVLPLVMVIFGIGETSTIIVVALGTFFPMLINAMAGVRQIHPIHFEVAKSYRTSAFGMLSRVVLPGSLPLVLAGVRLSFNTALLLTISVEMVSARQGLGALVWFAWQTMRTADLYAGLLVIAAVGYLFNVALARLSRRLTPWAAEIGT